MARPSKIEDLTEGDKATFLAAIDCGTPLVWACREIGISEDTLSNWRKLAHEGDARYVDFIDQFERREGRYVHSVMQVMDLDGKGLPTGLITVKDEKQEGTYKKIKRKRGNLSALQWKLERLHPKQFAPIQKQEHSGPDGGPIPGARVVYLPPKDIIPDPEPVADDDES